MATQRKIQSVTITPDENGASIVNVAYEGGEGESFVADTESIGIDLDAAETKHCSEHGINRAKWLYVSLQAQLIASGDFTPAALENALGTALRGKTVFVDFGSPTMSRIA